jgi:hypothetical protein
MSVDFGTFHVTTYNQPEGGAGTYKPSFFNLGVSYAKAFSDRIYGGATLRVISEAIPDASALGVAFDAGIQYRSINKRAHFGIALRNVGTPMRFTGEGLTYRGQVPYSTYTLTISQRAERFELPTMMHIGIGYDIIAQDSAMNGNGLQAVANFTSNSFARDQYGAGIEYRWKRYVALRAGYNYEPKATSSTDRTNALTGPAFGASFEVPMNRERGVSFGLDYSYRVSNPFAGSHGIGARLVF